jgi:hypothetical protein
MNRTVLAGSFAAGLAVVVWVAWGFVGVNALALGITGLIAGVYLLGGWELWRYRAQTAVLDAALEAAAAPPPLLDDWLARVPLPLRAAVRLRIEGERVALPGPALAPYLVGLLVMLGMLGTFLGMVVTFQGAVLALEGSADLLAIRSALSAPIKGLGLSFGTSVAGVAASAMLGLLVAWCRRERAEVARRLDMAVATALRPFSALHQRQATHQALQAQAEAWPELLARLQTLADGLEQRGQQWQDRLLAQQQAFQHELGGHYAALARDVGQALQGSLVSAAEAAGHSLRPVVDAAMTELAAESARQHERQVVLTQGQLQAWAERFQATADVAVRDWALAAQQQADSGARLLQGWTAGWAETQHGLDRRAEALLQAVQDQAARLQADLATRADRQVEDLARAQAEWLARSDALVLARTEAEATGLRQHGERLDGLVQAWRQELATLRDAEAARSAAAVAQLGGLQSAMAEQLATLGTALEAPLGRLLHTVAEVPQAAAEVMGRLREESTRLTGRDNRVLQERTELLAQVQEVLAAVRQSADEQRQSVATLATASQTAVAQTGERWSGLLDRQAGALGEASTQVQASALELASLGEAFQHGMQLFQASNAELVTGLQRVETALAQSLARSDEQLAYYVAQAREVIDLSIASQQGILDDLRRLRRAEGVAP